MEPRPSPATAVNVFVDRRIVFASDRDGNYEIYTVNTDGSNLSRLTDNPASDSQPMWSPDGKKIVFASNRDGNLEIYGMNPDDSQVARLTNDPANDLFPA